VEEGAGEERQQEEMERAVENVKQEDEDEETGEQRSVKIRASEIPDFPAERVTTGPLSPWSPGKASPATLGRMQAAWDRDSEDSDFDGPGAVDRLFRRIQATKDRGLIETL
jgi:hypothetical protein